MTPQLNTLHASRGQLNTLKDRAFTLLAMNIPPTQVAAAIGCSPSYVSQLLSDPSFAGAVKEAQAIYVSEKLEQAKKMDDLKDSIESQLLDKLQSTIAYLNKPSDILLAVKIANSLKRSQAASQIAPAAAAAGTVKLSLPAHLLQHAKLNIQISPAGEVLATEGATFLSPPAAMLLNVPPSSSAPKVMENNLDI